MKNTHRCILAAATAVLLGLLIQQNVHATTDYDTQTCSWGTAACSNVKGTSQVADPGGTNSVGKGKCGTYYFLSCGTLSGPTSE